MTTRSPIVLLPWAQGQFVHIAMLNIIIAACTQVGDLARAFETFEVGRRVLFIILLPLLLLLPPTTWM